MITSAFDPAARLGTIVLEPNRSWTWRANLLLIATLLTVSCCIGIGFLVQGLWMILPFNLLEIAVLTGCLYYCVRRTHMQEVLTFSPDSLVVERGVRRPSVRFEFQRYFTRFFVRSARHPWYRRRVALKCRNTELEIGGFLRSEEVDDLIRQLRAMIDQLDQLPPESVSSV